MRTEQQVNTAIETYSDMVLRLCGVYLKNDADAEDIFQTVFLKYALRQEGFDSAEHEKAWFIRVTVNACKDLLKSFFRSKTVPLTDLPGYLSGMTPDRLAVMEAVWALPRAYREVIYLHYYEGYTAPEIAGILHRNPNTVYTHLDRVIALEGLNPDGEKLAAALDVAGMDYGDAMGRIMVSDELGGYLDAGNLLSITVSGRGAEQTLKQVVCRAYAVAEDEQVFYILADDATVRAAKAEGLSVVQYEALTALRQSDPAVTAEDVRSLTMTEIRGIIGFEKLDDPCGEK